jgi:hypothetical protein
LLRGSPGGFLQFAHWHPLGTAPTTAIPHSHWLLSSWLLLSPHIVQLSHTEKSDKDQNGPIPDSTSQNGSKSSTDYCYNCIFQGVWWQKTNQSDIKRPVESTGNMLGSRSVESINSTRPTWLIIIIAHKTIDGCRLSTG